MNVPLFVGLVPTLPAGGVIAILLTLLPCLLPGIAVALAADPSDPAAPIPGIAYRSAFDGYEPWRENPKTPWRESNELVGRMGGHMGHMEDAAPPVSPSASQPAGARPPSAQSSGGGQHQHHKP